MNSRQSTRNQCRYTFARAAKDVTAVRLACSGILVALLSAPVAAQCLPANSVEVQGALLFDCSLRVTADVPSLFLSRAPHDTILTSARNNAAAKVASNSDHIAHTAVLTTCFASDTVSLDTPSSFDPSRCMLTQSFVQGNIALPQNSTATDQPDVRSTKVSEALTYQPMDFNKDGGIDFFDYLDFIQATSTMFDGSGRAATSP